MSSKLPPNAKSDRWTRGCTAALAIGTGGFAWVGSTAWVIHRQKRLDERLPDRPCPALVLGCRPGPALDARVKAAAELYRRGLADRVIISGFNECAAGAEIAYQQGVPLAAVDQENEARNTWENLTKSARFLSDDRLWIATDRWHQPRALWFARRQGLEAYPCPVDRIQDHRLSSFAREGLSVLHGWVRQGRAAFTE